MFCPKCGNSVEEGNAFCGTCGQKMPKIEEIPVLAVEEKTAEVAPAVAEEKTPVMEEVQPVAETVEPVAPVVETPVAEEVSVSLQEEIAETKPEKPKVLGGNGMSVAGFILSFFVPLLGLIFGIVGVTRARKLRGKGRVLGIFAIILSILMPILQFIVGFAGFVFYSSGSCMGLILSIFYEIYFACYKVWILFL